MNVWVPNQFNSIHQHCFHSFNSLQKLPGYLIILSLIYRFKVGDKQQQQKQQQQQAIQGKDIVTDSVSSEKEHLKGEQLRKGSSQSEE